MQLPHRQKRHTVTGATSETNRFLQYPVMSTLRPAYPRGPWHYKNMHQLSSRTRAPQRLCARFSHHLSNLPTVTASP